MVRNIVTIVSFFLLGTGLFMSCSESSAAYENPDEIIKGSNILVTESRELPYFTEVCTSGPITTVINQGNSRETQVTADNNVLKRVRTIVQGKTLHISLQEGEYSNILILVKVNMPAISTLSNLGSGTMKFTTMDSTGHINAVNSGSGTLILQGRGKALTIFNEGAGTVEAFGYMVEQCTVRNAASGQCELSCHGLLDGSNVGSGSIYHKGSATVTIENTGAGNIIEAG